MIPPGRLFNFSAPRGSPFPGAIFTGEGGGGGGGGGCVYSIGVFNTNLTAWAGGERLLDKRCLFESGRLLDNLRYL